MSHFWTFLLPAKLGTLPEGGQPSGRDLPFPLAAYDDEAINVLRYIENCTAVKEQQIPSPNRQKLCQIAESEVSTFLAISPCNMHLIEYINVILYVQSACESAHCMCMCKVF